MYLEKRIMVASLALATYSLNGLQSNITSLLEEFIVY